MENIGTDAKTRVRLLFVGVLFLSSFVGFTQTQKRYLFVEGNGFVRVTTSFSNVINFASDSCGEFYVKDEGGEYIDFVIKPSSQYYLDRVEIDRGVYEEPIELPKKIIYAGVDDSLYLRYDDFNIITYRFIFKEVQPLEWEELEEVPPYVSRDGLYGQVYTPAEWLGRHAITYYPTLLTISLQNNLEMKARFDYFSNKALVIKGNNKIIKGVNSTDFEQSKCIGLHIISGFAMRYLYYSIAIECTFNGAGDAFFEGVFNLGKIDALKDSSESRDCINFADVSYSEGARRIGSAFAISHKAKNLMNWGSDISQRRICPVYKANDTGIRVSNVFNFGRFGHLISLPEGTKNILFYKYFNDRNLAPETEMPTYGAEGYNLESRQLIDSAFMRNLMGDDAEEDFVFEDGFYPRLRHMDERPGRLAASPILLYPGENADSVVRPFYVDTNYGVRWVSLSPGLVEIVGDSGYVRMPVSSDSVVRIEAWKEDFSKHVYLTIRARSFVNKDIGYDTVCPDDSVWMINTYARNEGWNYDVVWGEGNEASPDTVYRLHLYHNPTYHDTLADSCYIEELPYAVGGRLMQDFGEQTERYVTAAGCDSVFVYSLSRRWHHYRVSVRVKGEGVANVTDTVLREDGSMWLVFSTSACYKLDSLRIDGRDVPPQSRYLLRNLHGDCTVEVVFGPVVPESVLRHEACRDSLPIVYNGEFYGEGEHEIVLQSAAGCDSVVKLYVQGKENVARLAVVDTIAPLCNASEIAFSYNIEAGSPRWLRLAFDPVAGAAGFRDTVLAVGSTGGQTVRLALPSSAGPDRYGMRLWQTDVSGCYAAVEDMAFEIPYPADIIVQKWSDVLAVLSSEYNGGYEFSGYQWYKNGEAIEGATRPYYQAKPYLRSTDTYAVLLERASDGLKLQSCGVKRKSYPKELSLELLPNPTVSGEAVTVRVNGKPEAEGIIEVFDGVGKPVYECPFRESHILPSHWQPGTYVVRVRNAKSTWIATGKLIIR